MRLGDLIFRVRDKLNDIPHPHKAVATGNGEQRRFTLPDRRLIAPSIIAELPFTTNTTFSEGFDWPDAPMSVKATLASSGSGQLRASKSSVAWPYTGQKFTTQEINVSGSGFSTLTGVGVIKSLTIFNYSGPANTLVLETVGSLACYVDEVLQVDNYTIDYMNGVVEFYTGEEPANGSAIEFEYYTCRFSADEVRNAVTGAIFAVLREVPKVHSTTVTFSGTEAVVPGAHNIVAIEYDDDGKYMRRYDWRTFRDDEGLHIKLYSSPDEEHRVFYTSLAVPESYADDLDDYLPVGAENAIVYKACADLLYAQLASRVYTNEFKNVEGGNVVRVYELQRAAADFISLYEMEMKKVRAGTKWWVK